MYSLSEKVDKGQLLVSYDAQSKNGQNVKRHIVNKLCEAEFRNLSFRLLKMHGYPTTTLLVHALTKKFVDSFHGDYNKFSDYVINSPYQYVYDDNSIFNISNIAEYYSDFLTEEFFNNIIHWRPEMNCVSLGRVEMLLGLFTQLVNSVDKGDLKDDDVSIEIKDQSGRMRDKEEHVLDGAAAKDKLCDFIATFLPVKTVNRISNVSKTIGKNMLTTLFDVLDESDLCEHRRKKLIDLLINYHDIDCIPVMERLFNECIQSSNCDKFISFCITLHLYSYQIHEDMDWFIITNKDRSALVSHDARQGFESDMEFVDAYITGFGTWNDRGAYSIKSDF